MDFETYLLEATGMNLTQIAKASGIQQSKLSRQLNGGTRLSMETVRDIARGTSLDLLDLLKASGFITELEMLRLRRTPNLTVVPDEALAKEILRRMKLGATYYDEHSPFDAQDDFDLAAKRSTESKGEPDPFE
ncbi:helix-turn-helix domain-containing protein [Rothia terrae]|uniref:helix-turn-helix domain-containing protein n=1 Tax=Rothia terrae TaxID=396015 RepID=UPI00381A1643